MEVRVLVNVLGEQSADIRNLVIVYSASNITEYAYIQRDLACLKAWPIVLDGCSQALQMSQHTGLGDQIVNSGFRCALL